MRYERLSDRLFGVLKYDMVLWAFIFSSDSFFQCNGMVVLLISFLLSYKRIKPFKAMLWCMVQRVKIMTRLVDAVILVQLVRLVVVQIGLVFVFGQVKGWEFRELPHELYHNRNRRLYDTILTDKHTITIHITAYSILTILIIYQDKKIG